MNSKTLPLAIGLFVINAAASAQNQFSLDWANSKGKADYEASSDIVTDAQKNVYIVGNINDTIDFDPGPGVVNLAPPFDGVNNSSAFVAKYDSLGNLVWARAFYPMTNSSYSAAYNVDVSSTTLAIHMIFTNTGAFGFAYKCNSPNTQSGSGGYAIEIVNNSIYISGSYRGTVDVDITQGGVNNVVGGAVNSPFIAKYSMSGALSFIQLLPSTTSEAFKTIKYSNAKLYLAGDLYDSLDVDPGPGVFKLRRTGTSGADIMIARYDTLGNFLSAFETGNNGSQYLSDIAPTGNKVFATGYYQNSMDVDPSPATLTLTSNGGHDMYVLCYSVCIAAPAVPGAITGPLTLCQNSMNTYTVAAVNGATSYTWTLPSGWTGSSATSSINATASAASGTITVVANNACGSSPAQTIAVTVHPVFTVNTTAAICQGDSLLLGGSYQKTAGSYMDMLQSVNGCDSMVTTALTINPLPVITTTGDTTICAGDLAVLTAYGAASYTWQPGNLTGQTITVNPNQLTTYLVQGTDANGCKNTAMIVVTVNPLPLVNLSNQNPVCIDVPAFALSGGTPAGGSYSGTGVSNNQFNPAVAAAGTHTITYSYTDANTGCSNSSTNTILVNPLPPVPTISANGNTFTSSAASGNQWYMNGNAVNGATGQTFTCTANGNYTVCVTDANGCKSCSSVLNFTTFGMIENQDARELSVYPNPFSGEVTLKLSKGKAQATIYNSLGEIIYSAQLTDQPLTIHLQEVPTGIYFLRAQSENGTVTKKIIKQ